MWAGGGLVYVLPPAGLAPEVVAQLIDMFVADGRFLYWAELRLLGDLASARTACRSHFSSFRAAFGSAISASVSSWQM